MKTTEEINAIWVGLMNNRYKELVGKAIEVLNNDIDQVEYSKVKEENPFELAIHETDRLRSLVENLPTEVDFSDLELVRKQFERESEVENPYDDLRANLWGLFEELNIPIDLSDDGMDEAEEEIDNLLMIIRDTMDRSKEVNHITYLGYRFIKYEYLNESHPALNILGTNDEEYKIIKEWASDWSNHYSEALKLFFQVESGC